MSAQTYRQNGRGNGETQWGAPPDDADLNEHIEHHRAEIDRTLSALEGKLSASDMIDDILRNMKSGPGQFVTNLGTTVRDNPIPIALIGVGLAWLMIGQGDGTGQLRQKIGQMAAGDDTDDRETAHHDDGSVHDMSLADLYAFCLRREYPFDEDEIECILFEDLGPAAASEYRGGAFGPQSMGMTAAGAGRANDDAKSRIDRTRLRMSAGADDVRSRASAARRQAKKRAKGVRNAVSAGVQQAAARTGDLFERYPLSVLALGVAAGAALGAGMPSTDAEDRLMGESSDAVKQEAGEVAHDTIDQAKRTAKAATEAAQDEAHEQGLDPEGLVDKGLAVTERAGEAAKQEAGSHA